MQSAEPEYIQDLVRRARLGDSDAFGQLYTVYFTPLYRYVYFRVSDKEVANDLTQEVFLRAYASFEKYASSTVSPLPYFYTIARNSVIDYYRKKKTLSLDEDSIGQIEDTDSPSPEDESALKEEYQHVLSHMSKLSQDQQDVIVLRFINGLSTKEIAKMIKRSEASVRQLQSRGLRVLRESM
jgi:RNA polymerase sigma-70 factor (ECF subfamily)